MPGSNHAKALLTDPGTAFAGFAPSPVVGMDHIPVNREAAQKKAKTPCRGQSLVLKTLSTTRIDVL